VAPFGPVSGGGLVGAHPLFGLLLCNRLLLAMRFLWAQALRRSPRHRPTYWPYVHMHARCMLVNLAYFIADVALSLTTNILLCVGLCGGSELAIAIAMTLKEFCRLTRFESGIRIRLRNQVESGFVKVFCWPLQLLHHMSQGLLA